MPNKVINNDDDITLILPYILSYSFREIVFTNIGAKSIIKAIVNLLARIATFI